MGDAIQDSPLPILFQQRAHHARQLFILGDRQLQRDDTAGLNEVRKGWKWTAIPEVLVQCWIVGFLGRTEDPADGRIHVHDHQEHGKPLSNVARQVGRLLFECFQFSISAGGRSEVRIPLGLVRRLTAGLNLVRNIVRREQLR